MARVKKQPDYKGDSGTRGLRQATIMLGKWLVTGVEPGARWEWRPEDQEAYNTLSPELKQKLDYLLRQDRILQGILAQAGTGTKAEQATTVVRLRNKLHHVVTEGFNKAFELGREAGTFQHRVNDCHRRLKELTENFLKE